MNQTVKIKWLEALRSGKYNQTKQFLKTNTGFCCLGVLCDLYSKENTDSDWQWDDHYGEYNFDGQVFGLPEIVMDWAGLLEYIPEVIYKNKQTTVAHMNDNDISFREIANVIENQL